MATYPTSMLAFPVRWVSRQITGPGTYDLVVTVFGLSATNVYVPDATTAAADLGGAFRFSARVFLGAHAGTAATVWDLTWMLTQALDYYTASIGPDAPYAWTCTLGSDGRLTLACFDSHDAPAKFSVAGIAAGDWPLMSLLGWTTDIVGRTRATADYPPEYVVYLTGMSGGTWTPTTPAANAVTEAAVLTGVAAGPQLTTCARDFECVLHPETPAVAAAVGSYATPLWPDDGQLAAGFGRHAAPWGVTDCLAAYRDGGPWFGALPRYAGLTGALDLPCALAFTPQLAPLLADQAAPSASDLFYLVVPEPKLLGKLDDITRQDPVWDIYYSLSPLRLIRTPAATGTRT